MTEQQRAETLIVAATQAWRLTREVRGLVREQTAARVARCEAEGMSPGAITARLGLDRRAIEDIRKWKPAERVALSLAALGELLSASAEAEAEARRTLTGAVAEGYKVGLSAYAIRKLTGASSQTVYAWLREEGVKVGEEPAELAAARGERA